MSVDRRTHRWAHESIDRCIDRSGWPSEPIGADHEGTVDRRRSMHRSVWFQGRSIGEGTMDGSRRSIDRVDAWVNGNDLEVRSVARIATAHARARGDGSRHARARGVSRDGWGEAIGRWILPRQGVREVRGRRERGVVVSGIRSKGWGRRRGGGGERAIDRGRGGGERVGETEEGVGRRVRDRSIDRRAEEWSRAPPLTGTKDLN